MEWYAKLAVIGVAMVLWNAWLIRVGPAYESRYEWIVNIIVGSVYAGLSLVIIAAVAWLLD